MSKPKRKSDLAFIAQRFLYADGFVNATRRRKQRRTFRIVHATCQTLGLNPRIVGVGAKA